jgi:hypothetical protein
MYAKLNICSHYSSEMPDHVIVEIPIGFIRSLDYTSLMWEYTRYIKNIFTFRDNKKGYNDTPIDIIVHHIV